MTPPVELHRREEEGLPVAEAPVLPQLTLPGAGMPVWMIATCAIAAAALLFIMLDGRRRDSMESRSNEPTERGAGMIGLPPPLVLPDDEPLYSSRQPLEPRTISPLQSFSIDSFADRDLANYRIPDGPSRTVSERRDDNAERDEDDGADKVPRPTRTGPASSAIVYDNGVGQSTLRVGGDDDSKGTAAARAGPARAASLLTARERAGYLRNPATTVVQGAIVPAVLETAIDSTRPAIVRAMVSRDIRGFDGSRVLIPRGSRLVGEYRADTLSGQKRVMVSWSRLIRPDGATISLDSPSGDLLGRGGIKGKVDTHFFERFGSALLQSVLDIGVNVASSSLSDSPVFVGVPGNVGSAVGESATSKTTAPPTIKVRQGATIAVLVARDLDFTSVENR